MNMCCLSVRTEEFDIIKPGLYNAADISAAHCFGIKKHFGQATPINKIIDYDGYFFTMWKVKQSGEKMWLEKLHTLRKQFPNKFIILHQEAEADWWIAQRTVYYDEQKDIMEILKNDVDLFLAHDERAQHLYQCFMKRGKAYCWSTVQDIGFIQQNIKNPASKTTKPIGISTFDGRANGITGIAVASQYPNPIIQINRAWYVDDRNTFFPKFFNKAVDITPVLSWNKWLACLTHIYVYLHPMPAASAGRDTIACAALGIPVIGNYNLDAQKRLFPELGCDPYDVRKMKELLDRLLNDNAFYGAMRSKGLEAVKYHTIEAGEQRAKVILKDLGK